MTAASDAEILAHAVNWQGEPRLRRAAEFVLANGSPSVAARAERILSWLSLDAETRTEFWDNWREDFHTKAGQARAAGAFVNANLSKKRNLTCPGRISTKRREIDAVEDNLPRAVGRGDLWHALVTLADPMLRAYADRKANAGLLDYDDLIGHASQLLIDPGAALGAVDKLDGGIDHLLLDECAGHRNVAMAHRACVDRGVLRRAGRARRIAP